DAFLKTSVRRIRLDGRPVTVAALGKGGGMIAPGMATLLVFVLTDACVAPAVARHAIESTLGGTLNAITVDGDMSTNDTVLLLASGAAGNRVVRRGSRQHARFTDAVREVLGEIGRLVVLDGEGATRAVDVVVRGARTPADASRVARAIGSSTLCKAAFHGGDPNWGRFVCAAGTAGVPLDAQPGDLVIGRVGVWRAGRPIAAALPRAARRMRAREVEIVLDLHLGRATGRVLTSDLTPAYVHFNAAYTT